LGTSTNPLILNVELDGCEVVSFTLQLLYSREAKLVCVEFGVGWTENQSGFPTSDCPARSLAVFNICCFITLVLISVDGDLVSS